MNPNPNLFGYNHVMNNTRKPLLVFVAATALLVSVAAAQVTDNKDRKKKEIAKVSKQLYGTWVFDAVKTIEENRKNQALALEEAKIEHYKRMEVTFNNDGSFITLIDQNSVKRSWEVKKLIIENMNHVLVLAWHGSKIGSTEVHILGDNRIKFVNLGAKPTQFFMKRKTKKKLAAAAQDKELPR